MLYVQNVENKTPQDSQNVYAHSQVWNHPFLSKEGHPHLQLKMVN